MELKLDLIRLKIATSDKYWPMLRNYGVASYANPLE